MPPPDNTMKEATRELHNAVEALKELLERDYPKRSEIEKHFLAKAGQPKRWLILLSIILGTTVFSFFGTVATISTCFLRADRPVVCKVLPGYSESTERNAQLIEEFRRLQELTQENKVRIDNLEHRIGAR